MLNALVTLPILLVLAGTTLAMWDMLVENAPKVLAALKGESLLAEAMITRPVKVRYAPRQVPARAPVRTSARWRAAA